MHFVERVEKSNIIDSLSFFPAVAILGPRQSGKTTLSKQICCTEDWVTLDLEKPSDLAKLEDAESFFQFHRNKNVCLDEVQRRPQIFSLLRSIIDEDRRPGRFLLLGSASVELLQQSSESLAGRISYHSILPLNLKELTHAALLPPLPLLQSLISRGGFPQSFLAPSDSLSWVWRQQFVQTFLERDLGLLDIKIPPLQMRRLWLMCAHFHGQILNYSKIASSLDVTHPTVKSYIDTLNATFMLRYLTPWEVNLKKRLVKSPKIYIRDSGILACLLELSSFEQIFSHPSYGAFWEGVALENIIQTLRWQELSYGFFRTHTGEEIDLIGTYKQKILAFEFKTSSSPKIPSTLLKTLDELKVDSFFVVTPNSDTFTLHGGRVKVTSLHTFLGSFSISI